MTQIPLAFNSTSSFVATTTGNGITLGGEQQQTSKRYRFWVMQNLEICVPQFQTKLDVSLEIAKQLDVVDVGGGASEALNLWHFLLETPRHTPADNFTAGLQATFK